MIRSQILRGSNLKLSESEGSTLSTTLDLAFMLPFLLPTLHCNVQFFLVMNSNSNLLKLKAQSRPLANCIIIKMSLQVHFSIQKNVLHSFLPSLKWNFPFGPMRITSTSINLIEISESDWSSIWISALKDLQFIFSSVWIKNRQEDGNHPLVTYDNEFFLSLHYGTPNTQMHFLG